MYNCEEVAERYNVKLITVWSWIRDKKLPAMKIGREYRIKEEDLTAFEDERRTVSVTKE
ncbi:helix-turn-helix domain-containing protein [Anaerotignum propionicum]|uniref:helix-turn-helix domain-containing protein n=1 Tax=Anaerotignum propionicum TaxID=28446 RepID=UPI00210D15E9|nr:helix-turn-helix domain-containing protein [Anaerotignum propionicum]MCQ4934998.1 helix-turn-helix domain-containing protein [Anaerotignum propionicum]